MDTKQIQLILEYLAKSKATSSDLQKVYIDMVENLAKEGLFSQTFFSSEQIKKMLKNQIDGVERAKHRINLLLLENNSEEFKTEKSDIFKSLMVGNFPSYKAQIEKSLVDFEASLKQVEAKIYTLIKTYIELISQSLELFIAFDTLKVKKIEELTNFVMQIHKSMMENLFFDEEKALMDDGLKQVCIVYIGIYYKNFYI